MNIKYLVAPQLGVTYEKWLGPIRIDDLVQHWHHKLANDEAVACNRILVDLREAELPFTGDEFRVAVRGELDPLLHGRALRIAHLARTPLQYGMARMFAIYLEEIGTSRVFTDEVEARRWLVPAPPAER